MQLQSFPPARDDRTVLAHGHGRAAQLAGIVALHHLKGWRPAHVGHVGVFLKVPHDLCHNCLHDRIVHAFLDLHARDQLRHARDSQDVELLIDDPAARRDHVRVYA